MFKTHVYANERGASEPQKQYQFLVLAAIRLGNRISPEGYDPFLFVLEDVGSRDIQILPDFWADAKTPMKYGQFAPILSLGEWDILFAKARSIVENRRTETRSHAQCNDDLRFS